MVCGKTQERKICGWEKIGSPMENRLFGHRLQGFLVNVKDMLKVKNYFVISKRWFTFAIRKQTRCLTIKD